MQRMASSPVTLETIKLRTPGDEEFSNGSGIYLKTYLELADMSPVETGRGNMGDCLLV